LANRPDYRLWTAVTVGFFVAVLVVVLLLLDHWQLLDRPRLDQRGEALVALFALLGIVFTGSITLIGVLLRLSFQERSLINEERESTRLRAETSLKALECLDHKY
jgi:hypothetical protein